MRNDSGPKKIKRYPLLSFLRSRKICRCIYFSVLLCVRLVRDLTLNCLYLLEIAMASDEEADTSKETFVFNLRFHFQVLL